jgi:Putative zinc-finger
MPHPSEAMLLAFADEELAPAERDQVSAHVQVCGVCRHALRDVRDAMAALRVEAAIVDGAEPASWREAVHPPLRPARPESARRRPPMSREESVHAARGVRIGAASGRARFSWASAGVASGDDDAGHRSIGRIGPSRIVAFRWAAILLVFVAGGATAMLAPRWRALLGVDATAREGVTALAAAPGAGAGPSALRTSAAVSVLPRAGSATVVLQPGVSAGAAMPAMLVVHVGDRADVQVTVTSPLASPEAPRFRTADGRLDVALAGNESRVVVDVPATLGETHIVLGTRTLVTVRAGVVSPQQASTTGIPLATER